MNILNSILYLIPDAKFSLWNCSIEEFQGEGIPIQRGNMIIAWNSTNSQPCPTLEQLEALDQNDVAASEEARRKVSRDAGVQNNLTIMSNYQTYLLSNPGVSLTAYLDLLENM
jgi:hypothetical protein